LTIEGGLAIIDSTLTIKSGHTLTIRDSRVYCYPDAQIIVMPGGKLVINNTIVGPPACTDWTWQGISVLGSASNPGILELNNTTIENAVCAIRLGDIITLYDPLPFCALFDGGIVYADNSDFVNNKQSVRYKPYAGYYYATYFSNTSYFNACTFTLNNNAYFAKAAKAQVELHGVRGISFTYCTFADFRTKNTASDYTTAIYANNSGIKVGNKSSYMSIPNEGWSLANL
jgi:hypothetical protein